MILHAAEFYHSETLQSGNAAHEILEAANEFLEQWVQWFHRINHSNYRISSVIRQFFFFQTNLKDLDPSCKMDLDLLDCLGRVNLVL